MALCSLSCQWSEAKILEVAMGDWSAVSDVLEDKKRNFLSRPM